MRWEGKAEIKWERGYREAKAYYNEHGNLEVPVAYTAASGFKLGKWLTNQRYRRNALKPEQKMLLDEIEMRWEAVDIWSKNYDSAKEYYEAHGSLNLPTGYKIGGIDLKQWLDEQRKIYCGKRKGQRLTQGQITKLESIGMDWRTPSELVWENGYKYAKSYYEKHGNLDMSATHKEAGFGLGLWLNRQRKAYADKKLTEKQIELLNQCGIIWDDRTKKFETGLAC